MADVIPFWEVLVSVYKHQLCSVLERHTVRAHYLQLVVNVSPFVCFLCSQNSTLPRGSYPESQRRDKARASARVGKQGTELQGGCYPARACMSWETASIMYVRLGRGGLVNGLTQKSKKFRLVKKIVPSCDQLSLFGWLTS